MWENEEKFSKAHPLNSRVRDTDIFLHATSMKKYLAIQSSGYLLKNAPQRNFSISQAGVVCFEKYQRGKYCGVNAKAVVDSTMKDYCDQICKRDQSTEGIILQINGKDLKKLGCPIYADWNKPYPYVRDSEWRPIDVDYSSHVLSIVVECDVPLEYLTVLRKVPFKE